MTDQNKPPKQSDDEDQQPEPGPTRRLEKAIEDMESGDIVDGTLVDIHAGTSEVPMLGDKEPSVSNELKKQKGAGGSGTPDVQPAATMYEPTEPGHVSGGSTEKTVFGPTGQGAPPAGSGPGTVNQPGGGRPVAPFGGKIMVGTRIGQIEVTGVLGKGGMGEVFKGYHNALDINVAIKVLPDELSRNELVRQRFLREARLCVKLDHPNIVRVYNVDEYAGNLYLVMEMIEGTDAANMLKNGGRFRYKRALEIGAASADALSYAHTQGLVHRDVKPHNILLGAGDGKIKLSDFGLARAATSSSHLTMSGQIMGTPHYMSPEQAEAKEVTDKSDVYSLGVTLYHMLTGETPFVGDTPISVAVQHIAKEIIYPEIRFKPFPKELVAVLKRMTAKDPAKRCSAKQAAVWLRKLISMAPQDDVSHPDEQAMQSMAPVVRESQAFEAAKKEREQRDNQARELAQTMLATIQEDSARRAAVQPTMQETAQPASSSQVIIERHGSGGLVVVLLLLIILGGGGAAGWYFMFGPGAQKANQLNQGNQNVAAANNSASNSAPANNSSSINANNAANNGGTDGGNTDGGAGDGGTADGGTTDGGKTDGGSADGGNTDGGVITPPPPKDNPLIAAALQTAEEGIAHADNLDDLETAKRKLDQARLEMSKASATQRQKFDELDATYQRQYALLATDEVGARIRSELEVVKNKRDTEREAAIASLNDAISDRDMLSKLKIPHEAEGQLGPRRDQLVKLVDDMRNDFWAELGKEAADLAELKQFTKAAEALDVQLKIHNTPEALQAARDLHKTYEVRALYKIVVNDFGIPDYKDAWGKLNDAEKIGIPDSLKSEHDELHKQLAANVEAAIKVHLEKAREHVKNSDFDAAQNEIDAAKDLPDESDDQTARIADMSYFISLNQALLYAENDVKAVDFKSAKEQLDKAASLLKKADAENRNIPQELRDRLATDSADYADQLSKRFEALLSQADAKLKARDFEAAGKNLSEADGLPLNEEQRNRLTKFADDSQKALADYVRSLIDNVEKALDANQFDKAQKNLETARSLSVPDDAKAKLAKLEQRFNQEAVKRHGELLDTARNALKNGDWKVARDSFDDAQKIPVAESLKAEAVALDKQWLEGLTAKVNGYFTAADKQLEDNKFAEAKSTLNDAVALPLTDDLKRQVQRHLKVVADKLDARLRVLLKEAKNDIDAHMFKSANEALDEAEKLDLDQAQLIDCSHVRDEYNKRRDGYIEDLFRQLKAAVEDGDEKGGKQLVNKLNGFNLGPSKQIRLHNLEEALTGETDEARFKRMPSRLKKLWKDKYVRSEQLINVGEEISALAVSPDGKYAVAGTRSGKVYFYNLKRGTRLGSSNGGRRTITAVAFKPDGSMAASGDDDGSVVLYKLSGSNVRTDPLADVDDDVNGLVFSASANLLYIATRDGKVTRYNPDTKNRVGVTNTGLDRAQCMQLSPNENLLALGGDDGKVAVFNARAMTLVKNLSAPGDDIIQRVSFSADGTKLMAGSIGDSVAYWDTRRLSEKPLQQFKGLSEWVRGVGFSNDGRRCAAFDSEERLVVWDTASGKEVHRVDFDKLKDDKDFMPSAGAIGADGTVLIGTREGELVQLTIKPAG